MNDSRKSLEETKGDEEVKEKQPHNQPKDNEEDEIYNYVENAN